MPSVLLTLSGFLWGKVLLAADGSAAYRAGKSWRCGPGTVKSKQGAGEGGGCLTQVLGSDNGITHSDGGPDASSQFIRKGKATMA